MSTEEVYLVNPNPQGYKDNPMTVKQARSLKKAFRARGLKIPSKIARKASGRSVRSNPRQKKAKGSRWMSLVKKHGVQKAAKMYRKNPSRPRKRKATKRKATKRRYRSNPGRRSKSSYAAAARKGWRSRKAGRRTYRQNPARRKGSRWASLVKRHGVQGAAQRYRRNPAVPKFLGGKKIGWKVFELPKANDYKGKKLLWGVGTTVLGLVDSSVLGMIGSAAANSLMKEKQEWVADTVGLATQFFGGTAISFAIGKWKGIDYAKKHQLGVYIGTILNIIGIILKAAVRKNSKITGLGAYELPWTPKSILLEVFGFGQIHRSWLENKIIKALTTGEEVNIFKGIKSGQSWIGNAKTGEVYLRGDAKGLKNVVGAFGRARIEVGEDITIEP